MVQKLRLVPPRQSFMFSLFFPSSPFANPLSPPILLWGYLLFETGGGRRNAFLEPSVFYGKSERVFRTNHTAATVRGLIIMRLLPGG